MPLSSVKINVGRGGIGRRAPNEDKISAMVFWNGVTPAGFSVENKQKVFSLDQAEQLGITDVLLDGTDFEHYQISEYFRLQPEGELWISWNPFTLNPTFEEIPELQLHAGGEIRQFGVSSQKPFTGDEPSTIQAQVDLISENSPCSVVYGGDFNAVIDLTALPDMRILQAPKVSIVFAQSGSGKGKELQADHAHSIANVGGALGTISSASVQESIGHPARFPISNGVEMEVLEYANGILVSATPETEQGSVKDKGYLIARKYLPQIGGSFWERCPTCVSATDDFAWIEPVRTIDKAIRVVSTALTPDLQSGVIITPEGTMSDDSIGYFQDLALSPLTDMQAAGEISDREVLIDPEQNIIATSTLEVTVKILPIGIAEFIIVNIGLTTELT